MKLSIKDVKRLHDAVTGALPGEDDLDDLTRETFNRTLFQITSREKHSTSLKLVIEEAETTNHVSALIEAARRLNPHDPYLLATANALLPKLAVADALIKFPLVTDPDTFAALIADLFPPEKFREAADLGDHLLGVVSLCQMHPPYILMVADALRQRGGAAASLQKLHEAFEKLVRAPIPWAEQAKLLAILRGVSISKEELTELYNVSGGDIGSPLKGEAGGDFLTRVVYGLADIGRLEETGTVPVVTFALGLASLRQPVGAALRTWAQDVGKLLGMSQTELNAPRLVAGAASTVYLLIELISPQSALDPRAAEGGKYLVQAWVTSGGSPLRMEYEDKTPRLAREVPELLPELFNRVANRHHSAQNNLVIEVFLPTELLGHGVEDWEMDDEPIGMRYPVVVRLLKRARNSRHELPWAPHCDESHLSNCPDVAVEWATQTDTLHWREVRDRLSEPQRVCLAVALPLDAAPDLTQRIERTLNNAGTPVAIWSRGSQGDAEQLAEEIESLLGAKPLSELPKTMREKRAKLWKQDAPRHLTLLWDDYKRRLPAPFLVPPEISNL